MLGGPLWEHADSPKFSSQDSHPHATRLPGRVGPSPSPWGRSPVSSAPQPCPAITSQDGYFPRHSQYSQVSDVVHHSPPFNREALGGDVVVVDLQENKCVSERSTNALPTGNATRGPCDGDTRPHSLTLHLRTHSEACERTANGRELEKLDRRAPRH